MKEEGLIRAQHKITYVVVPELNEEPCHQDLRDRSDIALKLSTGWRKVF
jgi:hypothetical protein